MPRVERALRAYQICKERVDAVQETLGKYTQKATAPSPTEPVTSRRSSRDAAAQDGDGGDVDDGIPF